MSRRALSRLARILAGVLIAAAVLAAVSLVGTTLALFEVPAVSLAWPGAGAAHWFAVYIGACVLVWLGMPLFDATREKLADPESRRRP